MTTETEDESWITALQRVDMPIELHVLALRTLGVSAAVIGRLLSRDPLEIDELAGKALTLCADVRLEVPDADCDFSLQPFGKKAIEALLKAGDFPVEDKSFTFKWGPTDKVYSVKEGPDGRGELTSQSARPEFRVETEPGFFDWFDEVRKVFLPRESGTELFVMLPLPMTDALRWTILRPQRVLSGRDDAVRLITSLSATGLGYGDSGHRTKFFSNLVWGCQMLFDAIGVGGAIYPEVPEYELLNFQASVVANDALFFRRDESKQGRNSSAQAFSADFSAAWQDNPNRVVDWSIRDRARDADEMADALLWLMTHTSGTCLQISLPSRPTEEAKYAVKVLAPRPWIDFVSQGHGAQRDKKVFDPYLHVKDGQGALYYVDEPLRYAQLKQRKKQGK